MEASQAGVTCNPLALCRSRASREPERGAVWTGVWCVACHMYDSLFILYYFLSLFSREDSACRIRILIVVRYTAIRVKEESGYAKRAELLHYPHPRW